MSVSFETSNHSRESPGGIFSSFRGTLASLVRRKTGATPKVKTRLGSDVSESTGQKQEKHSSSRPRVAIVGGGIGGLSLATFLSVSERGSEFDISIYESKPSLTELGAGVGIWLRTWKILESAGLAETLKPLVPDDRNLDNVNTLQKAFQFRRGDRAPEGLSFYDMEIPLGVFTLHRANFQSVLARRCIPPAKTHFGKKFIGYEYADEKDPSSEITLKFSDGSTARCDILVGADGVRSVTRRDMLRRLLVRGELEHDIEQLKHSRHDEGYSSSTSADSSKHNLFEREDLLSDLTEPVWSGSIAYRSLIPFEDLEKRFPGHRAGREPVIYFGKKRNIIAYPVRGTPTGPTTMINLVVFVTDLSREGTRLAPDEPWVRPASREEVLGKFQGWEEEAVALIELAERPLAWAVHTVRPLSKYSDAAGRVLLLGDAAHAMTPHQGAGAGQAIEDAYVLARLLAHPRVSKENVDEALRAYDSVRVAESQLVVERSRKNGTMLQLSHAYEDDEPSSSDEEEVSRLRKLAGTVVEGLKWEWDEEAEDQVVAATRFLDDLLAKRA